MRCVGKASGVSSGCCIAACHNLGRREPKAPPKDVAPIGETNLVRKQVTEALDRKAACSSCGTEQRRFRQGVVYGAHGSVHPGVDNAAIVRAREPIGPEAPGPEPADNDDRGGLAYQRQQGRSLGPAPARWLKIDEIGLRCSAQSMRRQRVDQDTAGLAHATVRTRDAYRLWRDNRLCGEVTVDVTVANSAPPGRPPRPHFEGTNPSVGLCRSVGQWRRRRRSRQ